MNLAGNAIKFTRQGRVEIGVELVGDDLVFHVSDTGIGIPKEELDNVFTEFQQVDAAVTREYGGLKIGKPSMVGLPRLSRISRAVMSTISDMNLSVEVRSLCVQCGRFRWCWPVNWNALLFKCCGDAIPDDLDERVAILVRHSLRLDGLEKGELDGSGMYRDLTLRLHFP